MQTELPMKGTIKDAWIETYTGRKINVFSPSIDDINITDIAHALACCVRFNGHLNGFLSVAEHSYWVSQYVNAKYALPALLHDASEAYLSDVPRPIKAFLPAIKDVEDHLTRIIFHKFLPEGNRGFPKQIHWIDRAMCYIEGKQGGMNVDSWQDSEKHFATIYPCNNHQVKFWNWQTARNNFLTRFHYLTEGRFRDAC